MGVNPYDPRTERKAWLRWQVSDELASSIAPGIREGNQGATDVLVKWLRHDRNRLVSHCYGAISSVARMEGIEPFTRDDIVEEIDLVAWCHKVDR